MGFNKHYVPQPDKLAELIKEKGPTAYMNTHRTVEIFLGDSESIAIIDVLQAGMKHGLNDDNMLAALKKAHPRHFN
jgi:hypothetical protein